jgi:hypothetical protein
MNGGDQAGHAPDKPSQFRLFHGHTHATGTT